MRIGIIPAGGQSKRWDGHPKEMLPVSPTYSLIDRTIINMQRAFADRIYIVSSEEKLGLHDWYIGYKGWHDVYTKVAGGGLKGAIYECLWKRPAEYLFGMPDTFTDMPLFPERTEEFHMGVFQTDQPERYGMIRDNNTVVDKQTGGAGWAWGALMWGPEVADYWRTGEFPDFPTQLTKTMRKFGYKAWEIEMYVDISNHQEYVRQLVEANYA